jgi:hypothetical protein
MMRDSLNRQMVGVFLVAFTALPGCGKAGSDHGDVSGTVKLDGQPIEQGSILFTPIDGAKGSVTGGPIEKGSYRLSGTAGPGIGWNRIEIRAMRKTGRMVPKPFSPPGQTIPEQVEAVSPRFSTDSKLKVEIKAGENTADFEVSSK